MRSLCGKAINNMHHLYLFYYCHLFSNIWHGTIIRTLVVPKIYCISRLNSWRNILDPDRKRQAVMRIKVHSKNKSVQTLAGIFWMDVEMIMMSCHWLIHPWTLQCARSWICLVCALSSFAWNLSYAWLKALVPASSLPILILSSAIFWRHQCHSE